MKTSSLLSFALVGSVVASSAFAQKAAPPAKGGAAGTAAAVSASPAASAAPSATTPPAPPAPPSLSETLTGTAKADYEAGKLLFGVSDFAAALIKFNAAHDASNDPRLLWNIATCEGKLHHYAKAVGMLRSYLKDGGALLSDQDRNDAAQTISAMEPLTSTMRITVNEAGADVFLDEQPIGKAPIDPVLVDIGVHKVRVHKDEFSEPTEDVTVNGGASQVLVDLKLHPIVHEGHVTITAGPKDSISIDGQVMAVGSWSGVLHSGGHTLRVTAPSMLPYQTEVLVQDDQSREIHVTLNPEPSKGLLPAWAWVAGGVVVAGGLGTGAYFLFKPTSKYDGPAGTLGPGLVQANAPVRF
jgi:hypothetical protein